MNRRLREAAELRLHQSTAWRDLHVECFSEIFVPGAGVSLAEALAAYQAWCNGRQVWASSEEWRRQLAAAGYRVRGGTILGVQLSAVSPQRIPASDELNIRHASQALGIETGLLRSLREFGGGPPFGSGPKGIAVGQAPPVAGLRAFGLSGKAMPF
jgi:hypothetical protein